ncbi:zinc ribbon domain-containing protein [Oscillospiraceae bacterium 44-34]
MERKNCPHCGAQLPNEAAFCPHCAGSIHKRTEVKPPRHMPGWALRSALIAVCILAVALAGWLHTRPKTYDDGGTATVIYTDRDGSYQLLLGWRNDPYTPAPEVYREAELDGEYRIPMCLFVHHTGSDANAANAFMNKVESVTAQFGPAGDPEGYITYTDPAPNGCCPEAMAVSFVDFLGRDNSAVGTWTITMNNGDVIRLHQTLEVRVIQTVDYYPEDVAMGTSEELQALIDAVSETADPTAVINLHLPAVTYDGDITIEKRTVNLLGSTEGEGRTVFTGTLRVTTGVNGWTNEISDIDFVGSGRENVGITAAARVHLTGCTFIGWKTAVLAHGHSWLNFRYCEFADNAVGFHFNASQSNVSHSLFTGNHFTENDTAILWEGTPVDVTISFHESVFSHNGTDIDNRSGQSIDISQATFE